jgi:pilus assembly protein Flp/PilA
MEGMDMAATRTAKRREGVFIVLSTFASNERGATAIEYGLILALLSLAVVAGTTLVGGKLVALFESIAELLS